MRPMAGCDRWQVTSEQKAQSWEWAADLLRGEVMELNDRGDLECDVARHRLSIADTLHRQAARIRSGSKARRERDE